MKTFLELLKEQLPEECVESLKIKTVPTNEEVLEVLTKVRDLIIEKNSFELYLTGPEVIPGIKHYPDFYKDLGILKADYYNIDYFSSHCYILVDEDLFIEMTKKYGVYHDLLQQSLNEQEEQDLLQSLIDVVKHASQDELKAANFRWPSEYNFLLYAHSVYHQYMLHFAQKYQITINYEEKRFSYKP